MLTIREQQIGFLEVIMYLMGIILVTAAVSWKWDLFLLLALILVALPFLTYLEIRIIEHENDPSRRSPQTVAKQKSKSNEQFARQSVPTPTKHYGDNGVDRPRCPGEHSTGTGRNVA
jgi:hypothetical protein